MISLFEESYKLYLKISEEYLKEMADSLREDTYDYLADYMYNKYLNKLAEAHSLLLDKKSQYQALQNMERNKLKYGTDNEEEINHLINLECENFFKEDSLDYLFE